MKERRTVQKDMIYAALCELKNHPTADMVYEKIHDTRPSISKATVYRVLSHLEQQGTILRVSVPDGADHFDHQTHPHYHICCDRCGKVDDVEMADLGDLCAGVTDSCGYQLMGYTVLLHGLCANCQKLSNAEIPSAEQ